MASRRSRSAWALVVASTLSAPFVTGCAEESREQVLKAFRLELPPCETRDMTFSGQSSAPGINLAMSFTAPESCVKQYLTDHQVDLERPVYWPASGESKVGGTPISPTKPPFGADSMKQFKLELDPSKKYEVYRGFTTPKKAEFKVLLVPQGEQISVYMECVITGEVSRRD